MATSLTAETLPTFASDEVVWDQTGYAGGSSDSFVRLTVSSIEPSVAKMPLQEVLDSTDEALEVFARRCGAFVLPHVWGLVEAPAGQEWRLGDELGSSTQHPGVPHGMLLAAKVERIIRPHQLPRNERKTVDGLSAEYYQTMQRTVGTPYLIDMRARQFSRGRLVSQHGRHLRILHDIEPRIAVNC